MKVSGAGILAALALVLGTACSKPVEIPSPQVELVEQASDDLLGDLDVPDPQGAGGAGADDNPAPNKLTGLPGIDNASDLDVQILDARGSGRLGGQAIRTNQGSDLTMGEWMLTDADSEYEITLRSSLLPDGIVRLIGQSAFLVEPPTGSSPVPGFRLFGGHASFYLPHLPNVTLTVLTPAGPLITRGAVFTVTVSPDFQVLVTCREGSVYLTGEQNAVALPGQVIVADRLGRGRVYAMTPNEALVFTERWLKVMTEEAAPVVAATLPRRLAEWNAVDPRSAPEDARFLALWFRQARTVLGTLVPAPDQWLGPLGLPVVPTVWTPRPLGPGLLGEHP